MKKFRFSIHGNKYNVEIKKVEGNIAKVEVNGTYYKVELEQEVRTAKTPQLVRSSVRTDKVLSKVESGTFKINCPLPGTIMSVMVTEGAEVNKGDTLLIYEAMKMENKVLAERKGVVKNIRVKPGDNILQDELLLEIH
ncbi:MAG: biotin/lipoyl-binding protein [Bacteroidales bacterium]|jgi:biotin carboxyl carrier protein|nr:biotin/lipoyl-binding protein [Bacteroidales bacterium]